MSLTEYYFLPDDASRFLVLYAEADPKKKLELLQYKQHMNVVNKVVDDGTVRISRLVTVEYEGTERRKSFRVGSAFFSGEKDAAGVEIVRHHDPLAIAFLGQKPGTTRTVKEHGKVTVFRIIDIE